MSNNFPPKDLKVKRLSHVVFKRKAWGDYHISERSWRHRIIGILNPREAVSLAKFILEEEAKK